MNRRLLWQVTAPAVLPAVLLLGACAVGALYAGRLQSNLTHILGHHVISLREARHLENNVRSLQFHSFLYMTAPSSNLEQSIIYDEQQVEGCLEQVTRLAGSDREREAVRELRQGYARYRQELQGLRATAGQRVPGSDLARLAEDHPIRFVTTPCNDYARLNEEVMETTSREGVRLGNTMRLILLVLGLGGPVAGFATGWFMTRSLGQSLGRLRSRVKAAARRLDPGAEAAGHTDGDLRQLDEELASVARGVDRVVERMEDQEKQMLRAQQLAAVGQLAASVAHEVRNPLTAIKMLVEAALRAERPRPFTPENLGVVHGEIRRLEQVVQNFLDFGRVPAPLRGRCDLRELAAQAADLVQTRARQQRVELNLTVPEQPVWADVDRGQLGTVLLNLLFNALDAMPRGGMLGITVEAPDTDTVWVSVDDTGEGIRPELMDRLFTPFVTTKATGTGLGLSTCRRIVEQHGGRIGAVNRAGGGASFRMTLAALPEEASHAAFAGRG